MWTRRPRVEEDSLRYLVVYIPWADVYSRALISVIVASCCRILN